MNIIFGNYGDNTVALVRWAFEHKLDDVLVLDVSTGWEATAWAVRVAQTKQLVFEYGFRAQTLQPSPSFPEQIKERGQFPTAKFQWCAGFIKGLPFIEWADQHDLGCEATVLMGSRRLDSRARYNLPEFVDSSEHFGHRRVWYPLYDCTDSERDRLVSSTGLTLLNQRSQECRLCVYSSSNERKNLPKQDAQSVLELEQTLNVPIQPSDIESFDLGCGSLYACGE